MLGNLAFVLLDEAVGGIGDGLRRTVVALQLEGLDVGIEALQPQDVVDIRPAETVDALGIVAHDTQAVVFLAQLVDNQVLREVGVLILVNQDVAEELLVLFEHLLVVAQQDVGVEQQVVKVHRSGNVATAPIGPVDSGCLGALGVTVGIDEGLVAGIVIRSNQGILGVADLGLDGGWLIEFVVEPHLLDDELDEGARVALVVDGEIGLEADALGIAAQQARENRVERAHPQLGGDIGSRQRLDALTHLSGCLVGERQRHDAPGLVPLLQQVHDFIGEHTGFARACTGNHQLRSVAVLDSRPLLFIQFLEIVFIHGCKYSKKSGGLKCLNPPLAINYR